MERQTATDNFSSRLLAFNRGYFLLTFRAAVVLAVDKDWRSVFPIPLTPKRLIASEQANGLRYQESGVKDINNAPKLNNARSTPY